MAYFTQEQKKEMAPKIKEICKKYGVKATLSVQNHSGICLNIKQGKLDFFKDTDKTYYNGMIPGSYYFEKLYTGKCLSFLKECFEVLNNGNHNNSDSMTDYFDIGWYIWVNIGQYDKPYIKEQG